MIVSGFYFVKTFVDFIVLERCLLFFPSCYVPFCTLAVARKVFGTFFSSKNLCFCTFLDVFWTFLLRKHRGVPENLHLQFLSICLGAAPGSSGVAVWHDLDPSKRPEVFKRLAVVGQMTWGLSLRSLTF